jgi:hypothetical protein
MRRIILVMAALGALLATPVLAETYFGFHIGVSNAPPPPRVYFRQEPRVVFVPQSRVYVVRDVDYDMFRYGRFWYVTRGGYWYRARSYRGPFWVVDARYVPRAIYSVPPRHWKHRHWDRRADWSGDEDGDDDGRTYYGFQVNVLSAPPPPRVYFYDEPEVDYVPESRVYVVRDFDYDMFRYGDSWYVCRDGYWYRSGSYRGPFQVVDARRVPAPIYRVPTQRWKDWRGNKERNRGRDRDRDHGRDRGRDHDRHGDDD